MFFLKTLVFKPLTLRYKCIPKLSDPGACSLGIQGGSHHRFILHERIWHGEIKKYFVLLTNVFWVRKNHTEEVIQNTTNELPLSLRVQLLNIFFAPCALY